MINSTLKILQKVNKTLKEKNFNITSDKGVHGVVPFIFYDNGGQMIDQIKENCGLNLEGCLFDLEEENIQL